MTNFERVKEFMTTFGQEVKSEPEFPGDEVSDALTDLLVVIYGAGHAFGIDLDQCFLEVHRSNMSKLGEDGKPIYREDGKVLKGPNYSPPNIAQFLPGTQLEIPFNEEV